MQVVLEAANGYNFASLKRNFKNFVKHQMPTVVILIIHLWVIAKIYNQLKMAVIP